MFIGAATILSFDGMHVKYIVRKGEGDAVADPPLGQTGQSAGTPFLGTAAQIADCMDKKQRVIHAVCSKLLAGVV